MGEFLHIVNIISVDEKEYVVSTVDLRHGKPVNESPYPIYSPYETMIFASEDGEVTNWADLYYERHFTEEEAEKEHKRIMKNLVSGNIELRDVGEDEDGI